MTLLVVGVLVSVFACGTVSADEKFVTDYNRFPVIAEWRFKEELKTKIVSRLFWLSDDELMFTYTSDPLPPRVTDYVIGTWRLSSNAKATHMPGLPVCVDPITRYVQISLPPANNASLADGYPSIEGLWNSTGEGMHAYLRYPEMSDLTKSMYLNPFSCKRSMGRKNDKVPGAAVFLLRDEHGFLHQPLRAQTSIHGKPQLLRHRLSGSGAEVDIDYREPEFSNTSTTYSPFVQKYMLLGAMSISNDTQPKTPIPFRLLSANGQIELFEPPPSMWAKARTHDLAPQLSNIGMLWYWWTNNPADALIGTYLQQGSTLVRFARGRIGVSPNGCRAFEHGGREGWIRVYELCKG